jgi:crotonobetainyl-CoA:carnitine CoA-transferase CaiB-like acyl-CoA transferase
MARLGLDLRELRRRTPALVVCSITGFGQDGPLATLPSHGMNMDALAGCVLTSTLDGRPAISEGTYTSIGTELGGVNAALAIVAAVLCARSTGRGAWIDASCWDAAVESHRFNLVHRASTGRPFMDLRGMGPLYDVYATADGRELFFGAIEEKFWVSFCEGVDRPDLLERWRGGDAPVHFAGDADLRSALEAIFAAATGAEWAERFAAWEVPGSLVMSVQDVLESDHLRARGLLRDGVGDVAVVCDPMRWMDDDTRPGAAAGPCSPIGADTEDVMDRWLSGDRTPGHDPRATTRGG